MIRPVEMFNYWQRLSLKIRILFSVWVVFFLLVGCGIHGSSTPLLSQMWSPEQPFYGYLAQSVFSRLERITGKSTYWLNDYALMTPRTIRSDEYIIQTGFALSQVAHDPPFPVINNNIGDGQNMFIVCCLTVPIWHPTIIARPITWGYFLFGAERGLAWQWWFGLFACFTALLLLLEIVLKGDVKLAAFGAFWFCSSAYIVAWSIYPAHFVFFPALGCWATHGLLISGSFKTRLLYGIVVGWSAAGFIMLLYPALQIPVLYACLAIFIGLFIRDRLDRSLKDKSAWLALILAGIIAGAITLLFALAALPALKVMTETVYPGQRKLLGGTFSFERLFKGMYNLITIYEPRLPQYLSNQSEAASFYYLFPGVLALLPFSRRLAKSLWPVGWALIGYLAFILTYLFYEYSPSIAQLTLMSRASVQRCDLGIGLASIVLCVLALSSAELELKSGKLIRMQHWATMAAAVITSLLFLYHGTKFNRALDNYFSACVVLLVALLAGLTVYWMLSGQRRVFCAFVSVVVLTTALFFNPLSYGLSHIYKSEMAQQLLLFNRQSAIKPYWVTFGTDNTALLVRLTGGRVLNGVHWHPQLGIWQKIDPAGNYASFYNRYANVVLDYSLNPEEVVFSNPTADILRVKISPHHPAFKQLGVRYVLVTGEDQKAAAQDTMKQIYQSRNGLFSIYELN